MKFLYSDTQDYVDPGYDFINDRNAPGRKRYWDDRYAHELLETPPYDGLLVSMSAIRTPPGVARGTAKYSTAEEQRFLRDGARKFLRFDGPRFADKMLMGDCGAFAYAHLDTPPYTPSEVFEFYADAGFTHGCAPDHIIFDFEPGNPPASDIAASLRERYEVTLRNSEDFLKVVLAAGRPFEPIGPVQGWSPESMAEAAVDLEAMGYRYLAVGGLVPLRPDAIHACLRAIRARISPSTRLHLLGFAKAEQIEEFFKYDIASFDSTSPLIRAFKDARANYYLESERGGLEYYPAIRIPQAIENARLMQAIKRGALQAEETQAKEARALAAIRGFDQGDVPLDDAVEILAQYQHLLTLAGELGPEERARELTKGQARVADTLRQAPWKRCRCAVCRDIGVEVIIFRSSNRNKRRGFHNLHVYHNHLTKAVRAPE